MTVFYLRSSSCCFRSSPRSSWPQCRRQDGRARHIQCPSWRSLPGIPSRPGCNKPWDLRCLPGNCPFQPPQHRSCCPLWRRDTPACRCRPPQRERPPSSASSGSSSRLTGESPSQRQCRSPGSLAPEWAGQQLRRIRSARRAQSVSRWRCRSGNS